MAAPRKYPEETREALLQLVSHGKTKNAACQQLGVPLDTVSWWIVNDEAFGEKWRAARIEQAHALADETLSIADEPVTDMPQAQRNRLRVDTRKWFTSKIAPKIYGEHFTQDHTHTVGVVLLPSLAAVAQLDHPENRLLPSHGATRTLRHIAEQSDTEGDSESPA